MIVVVASRHDDAGRTLVARWADHGAIQLTPEDLSIAGWRYYSEGSHAWTAVIGGVTVAVEDIKGVLIRLPRVVEQELGYIVSTDRAYVAAEMTAFLLSWLSTLNCPVLNRPTPICLSGTHWRPERWAYLAARIGIPVQCRVTCSAGTTPEALDQGSVTVTVVGGSCVGTADPALAAQALRLAAAAGVELLAVHFDGPEPGANFIGADPWPDVRKDEVADAILAYLQGDHIRTRAKA